jgi:hypothetical protein
VCKLGYVFTFPTIIDVQTNSSSSSSSFTDIYNPLVGISLLSLEVSRSHIMHNTVGRTPLDE